ITEALVRSGYDNVGLAVLNAADYGVPQERKRVFFLAASTDEIAYPMQDALDAAAVSLRTKRVSVMEAIGDLPAEVAADSGLTLAYPRLRQPSAFTREMRLDYDGQLLRKADKQECYSRRFSEIQLHNHHTKEIQDKRLRLIKLLKPGHKA